MIRIHPSLILAHDILGGDEQSLDGKGYPFSLGTTAIASFTFRAGTSVFAVDMPHQGQGDALAVLKDTPLTVAYELERDIEWPWLWIYDDTEKQSYWKIPVGDSAFSVRRPLSWSSNSLEFT